MGKIASLSNKINRTNVEYLPEYVVNSEDSKVNIYTVEKTNRIYLEYTLPERNERVKVMLAEKEDGNSKVPFSEIATEIQNYIEKQQEGGISYRARNIEYHKMVDFLKQQGYEISLRGNAIFRYTGNEPIDLTKDDLVTGEDAIEFLLAKEKIKVNKIKDIIRHEYEYEISEWEGLENMIDTLEPAMKKCIMNKDMYGVFGRLTDGLYTELVTEKQREGQKQYTDEEIKTIMQYFKNRKYFLQELGGKNYISEKLDSYKHPRIEIGGDGKDFVELINEEKLTIEQLRENPAYSILNRKDSEEIYNMAIETIRKEQQNLQQVKIKVIKDKDQEAQSEEVGR